MTVRQWACTWTFTGEASSWAGKRIPIRYKLECSFTKRCLEQAPFCAKIARDRKIIAITVDYCKAPYYEFPAALHDAEDVLSAVMDDEGKTAAGRILRQHIEKQQRSRTSKTLHKRSRLQEKRSIKLDSSQLSLSGFSSGGNLALNLALSISLPDCEWPSLFRPDPNPIPVFLFYPSFDLRVLASERELPSWVSQPGKFSSKIDSVLARSYLPENKIHHPRASPGLADMHLLNERARILLVLAEYDTLVEQSNAWIEKMQDEKQAGHMEVHVAKGMGHGFANIPNRFLSKKSLREKKKAFLIMQEFWDHNNSPNTNQSSDKDSIDDELSSRMDSLRTG